MSLSFVAGLFACGEDGLGCEDMVGGDTVVFLGGRKAANG